MAFLGYGARCILVQIDGELFAQKIICSDFTTYFTTPYPTTLQANKNKSIYDRCILAECQGQTVAIKVNKKVLDSAYKAQAIGGDCAIEVYGGLYSFWIAQNDSPKKAITRQEWNGTKTWKSSYINTTREDAGKYKKNQLINCRKVYAQGDLLGNSFTPQQTVFIIDDQGYLYSCGAGSINLGRPVSSDAAQNRSLKPVSTTLKFKELSVGFNTIAGISTDEKLYAWGVNSSLITALEGIFNDSPVPQLVQSVGLCKQVSCGDESTFFVLNKDGDLWHNSRRVNGKKFSYVACSGLDYLGYGIDAGGNLFEIINPSPTNDEYTFKQIPLPKKAKKIHVCLYEGIIQLEDNSIYHWSSRLDYGEGTGYISPNIKAVKTEDDNTFYAEDIGLWDVVIDSGEGVVFFAKGLDGITYSWGPGHTGHEWEILDWFPRIKTGPDYSYIPQPIVGKIWPDELGKVSAGTLYWIES